MSIRVLLVDDQSLIRSGLRMMLDPEPDIEVVAEATNGREAVERVDAHTIDVVLMDVQMPGCDGITGARMLLEPGRRQAPKVLMLTTFDTDEYVYAALRAGACGYLLKSIEPEELARATRTVVAGDSLLAPSVTRRLIATFAARGKPIESADVLRTLTTRELDVLVGIARGRSNAEIAASLHVGHATVKTHVAHILSKLDLRDRTQAVVLAYECGLIRPGT